MSWKKARGAETVVGPRVFVVQAQRYRFEEMTNIERDRSYSRQGAWMTSSADVAYVLKTTGMKLGTHDDLHRHITLNEGTRVAAAAVFSPWLMCEILRALRKQVDDDRV